MDSRYFQFIDTEEKAYWLGFITADGCVHGESAVSIKLHARDTGHLQKFADAVKTSVPVRDRSGLSTIPKYDKEGVKIAGEFGCEEKWCEVSEIRISSAAMARDLAAHGVVPAKSKIVRPWDGCFGPLGKHYFRGLVDGDGHISKVKAREDAPSSWKMGLVGSKWVAEAFAEWARGASGSTAQCRQRGQVFDAVFHGRYKVRSICKALYSGATVSLDRKQALSDEMLSEELPKVPRGFRDDVSTSDLVAAWLGGESMRSLSRKHGMALCGVQKRLKAAGVWRPKFVRRVREIAEYVQSQN